MKVQSAVWDITSTPSEGAMCIEIEIYEKRRQNSHAKAWLDFERKSHQESLEHSDDFQFYIMEWQSDRRYFEEMEMTYGFNNLSLWWLSVLMT